MYYSYYINDYQMWHFHKRMRYYETLLFKSYYKTNITTIVDTVLMYNLCLYDDMKWKKYEQI